MSDYSITFDPKTATEEEHQQFYDALAQTGNLANADTLQFRNYVCDQCPDLSEDKKSCSQCDCYLPVRLHLKNSTCPVGKWMQEK